jgi:hypothetical protein
MNKSYIIIIISGGGGSGMARQPSVGPWPHFQFLDLIHGRQDCLDGGSAHHKASTYTQNNTNRINVYKTDIHALSGFEPTIPAFEWANTFHALDRAATMIVKSHGIGLEYSVYRELKYIPLPTRKLTRWSFVSFETICQTGKWFPCKHTIIYTSIHSEASG